MGLKDEETNGHGAVGLLQLRMRTREKFRQGDKIAEALSHLLTVDGNHVVVHPVVHALGSALGHVLRDFALVVREHQVHAAAVDVELGAEVFLAHDRALQMPAGEAFSPW